MACHTLHGNRRGHSTRKEGPYWITALTNSTLKPILSVDPCIGFRDGRILSMSLSPADATAWPHQSRPPPCGTYYFQLRPSRATGTRAGRYTHISDISLPSV